MVVVCVSVPAKLVSNEKVYYMYVILELVIIIAFNEFLFRSSVKYIVISN